MTELNLSQRTFLVVDDETFSRTIVANMLRSLGMGTLFQAKDGAEALDLLSGEAKETDCVIADFNMPKMNGLELLKAIRVGARNIRRDIPFAMLTGHSDRELVGLAIQLDVNAFLIKPVSKKALVTRTHVLLTENPNPKSADEYRRVNVSSLNFKDSGDTTSKQSTTISAPMMVNSGVREQKVQLDDLPVNSVLSRDLILNQSLTFKAGTAMTASLIQKIKDLADLFDPIEAIWIKA